MSINFEYYKVFNYVAKYKKISLAAEKLFVSQPAVTQTIQKLEEQLNSNLFVRTKTGIELTETGKMLYEFTNKNIEILEKVLKDYVIEYQSIAKEMQNQYQNEKFTTILSADNYKNDGPDFVESKKLIADTRAKGEEVKTRLAEMVSNEYKQKRADDNGLTGKYKDLFVDSIQFEQELKQVDSTIDSVNNYLAKIEDVLKVGDKIKVRVYEIDEQGRINLTHKEFEENKED